MEPGIVQHLHASSTLRSRGEAGWLFASPFRPFFIGASAYAAMAVPVWVWLFLSGVDEVAGMPALRWHAHEMVLGYLPAVMAGYLLSTTPNWSGGLPASGWPLLCLFCTWVLGRLAPLVVHPQVGMLLDAVFPIAMAAVFLREGWLQPRKGSRHGLMLFPILAVAIVADRLFANDAEVAALFSRLGIAIGALLIAAVGGRLIPSFTRTELAMEGEAAKVPEPYGRFDIVVLLVASAGLVAWIAAPYHPATGLLAVGSSLLHGVRLTRWRGWLLRQFDTIALHLGYLWLTIGTLLVGLAADPLALVPPDAALHAFTAGAIGTMTLAVMSRLAMTRGPGRRARRDFCVAGLLLVNLGALLRVTAPLITGLYVPLLSCSGLAWSGGFAAFVLSHLPTRQHEANIAAPGRARSLT